ncbi:hypothetical protein KP509_15G028100 [Ceratopteris richardii]|uniref:Uncharacterized protein n=1 Tax=Ceratopteris richardii TaxID=49495 RepID=A0A8T2T206_CERRI|nr:hypothetical protein KP509_15G028000 [Ceratopteris richardii]KAH7404485.1 hypothetical protein KP509_15G028100 [Ceratopteris richardii]
MKLNVNTSLLTPRTQVDIASTSFGNLDTRYRRKVPTLQKVHKKGRVSQYVAEVPCGAPRASSSLPETGRSRRNIYREKEDIDNIGLWDSNAEAIRGSWSRTSKSTRSANDLPNVDAAVQDSSRQWWSGPDEDDYEGDADADYNDEDFWSIWDDLSIFSVFKLMAPAAVLLLPWVFGGPVFLMMAFAFFPMALKLMSLFVPRPWKDLFEDQCARSSGLKQKGRKKWGFWQLQEQDDFVDTRDESDFFNLEVADWEEALIRSSIKQETTSTLNGWSSKESKAPVKKKVGRTKKRVALEMRRRETPLFLRLLLAMFPFLRSWGGFL